MTTRLARPRALLLAAGFLLAAALPALAAGFDGGIKNNSLALSPDEGTAVVSYSDDPVVIVYDMAAGRVRQRLEGFTTPRNIVFSPDGARFYVSDSGTGRVSVFETATLRQVDTLAAGAGAFGTTLSRDGARLYVNNQAASTVSVFDTRSGRRRW